MNILSIESVEDALAKQKDPLFKEKGDFVEFMSSNADVKKIISKYNKIKEAQPGKPVLFFS